METDMFWICKMDEEDIINQYAIKTRFGEKENYQRLGLMQLSLILSLSPRYSLSTRMNGNWSFSNNPRNLPLLVTIHTRSQQLPFNSCWSVYILSSQYSSYQPLPLRLAYQFILSSRNRPGINLR